MRKTKQTRSDKLTLERQLCFALYATSRAVTRQYGPILDALGITYPQYVTLLVLWENDGLPVQDIADRIEIDQATATPLLQRLEKRGLITRQRSETDQRKVHIHLTPEGRALFDKVQGVPDAMGCALGIEDSRAQQLIEELRALRTTMSE